MHNALSCDHFLRARLHPARFGRVSPTNIRWSSSRRGSRRDGSSIHQSLSYKTVRLALRLPLRRCSAASSADASGEEESVRESEQQDDAGAKADGALGTNGSGSPEATVAASNGDVQMPEVPWGVSTIFQVMMLWVLAYILLSQVIVPSSLNLLGLEYDTLSKRGQAVLSLCIDLSQLCVTISILRHCLKEYKPRQLGLFPFKLIGLWPLAVLLGACFCPLVEKVSNLSLVWFPYEGAGQLSLHLWESLTDGDWVTNGAYLVTLIVITPIWEELIFRGFLLSSLTKHMSAPVAVVASSLIFALCHFRMHLFLPHILLGSLFSTIYLYCRNLVPAMVLHAGWNLVVLCKLLGYGA